MLADLYPMRRKLKNFWMHPNENLCRSLDLFGQDVYHNRTMLPPRETMLGSNLCKRTLQRCLCTNLPQFRRYSDVRIFKAYSNISTVLATTGPALSGTKPEEQLFAELTSRQQAP